jgi:ElaB/YqjD/DUF883 family membrane-anchored ribosome-binding protein
MDQEPDLTRQEPEVIKQQIDQTRSSLTEKLETLEHQVRGTVDQVRGTVQEAKTTMHDTIESVRGTVHDTVETVKGTVHDTVESMKRNFDLKYQVARHPWAMVGGSVLTGFLLGGLMPSQGRGGGWAPSGSSGAGGSYTFPPPSRESTSPTRPEASRPVGEVSRAASAAASGVAAGPSVVGKLMEQFAPEINQVKEVAIGTLFGLIRDFIKENVPPTLAPQVEKIMDDVTAKAGGKPISGPVVESLFTGPDHHRQEFRHPSGYANPVV